MAQEEYYDDPVYRFYEEGSDYEIFGNDEIGYRIYDHNGQPLPHSEVWDFDEAVRTANLHALENHALEPVFTEAEGGGAQYLDWTLSKQARFPGEAPVNLVIEWDNYPDTSARPGFKNDHHFPPDHYVAHSRGEHRYVDGAWSFHIDEIQSDWHHQGADSGYIDPEGKRVFIGYHDATDWILRDPQGRVVKDKRIYTSPVNKDDYYTEPQGSGMGTKQELIDYVNRIAGSSPLEDNALIVGDDVEIVEVSKIRDNPVAPAPFVSNWHEMMFKRSVMTRSLTHQEVRSPSRLIVSPGPPGKPRHVGTAGTHSTRKCISKKLTTTVERSKVKTYIESQPERTQITLMTESLQRPLKRLAQLRK